MSSSNWDILQQAIIARGVTLKKQGEEYRGNSPLRVGSDSLCFTIHPDTTGNNGTWFDHVEGRGGNFFQLAKELGVELQDIDDARIPVASTKRTYTGLEDYAKAHGTTAEFMTKAKWSEMTYQDRPALRFVTDTGMRYRFLDGQNPPFKHHAHKQGESYQTCWYYLDRAIKVADFYEYGALVICNGEASVVSAQSHNVPAFCQTTSSERAIPERLVKELNSKWQGKIIIVAGS